MAESFTIERIYIPSIEQSNAANAAADKTCNRNDMAGVYADCIIADTLAKRQGQAGVDWAAVNNAILARWPKGLVYIKERAWKAVQSRHGRAS